MKSILISIQPQYVEKILNREKIYEIRRTIPKEWKEYLEGKTSIKPAPSRWYIYCTNGYMLYDLRNEDYLKLKNNFTLDITHKSNKYLSSNPPMLNRRVVAEFTLKNISYWQPYWTPEVMHICDISEKSCVSIEDLMKYCGDGIIYALHIEDLEIYAKPKELSQFRKDLDCDDYPCNKGGKNSDCEYCYYDYSEGCQACGIDFDGEHCIYKAIKRPPQSWMFVESLEGK